MPTTTVTKRLLSRTRFMGGQQSQGFLRHGGHGQMLEAVGAQPAPLAARQGNWRADAPAGDRVAKGADPARRAELLGERIQFTPQSSGGFYPGGERRSGQFPEPPQEIARGAAPEKDLAAAAHDRQRPGDVDKFH